MKKVPFRVLSFAVFCLVMAGMAWYFAHWLESLPGRAWQEGRLALLEEATRIRDQFQSSLGFQPVIRIHHRVVFEPKSEIAELSLLSRPTEVDHEFAHTWAGSTKKLHLRGKFLVKSGFDLRHLEVVVGREGTVVSLPAAQILSAELLNLDLQSENGWWNQITDAERKQEIARLNELARQQGGALNREAEESFRRRLKSMLGEKVEVRIDSQEAKPEKAGF